MSPEVILIQYFGDNYWLKHLSWLNLHVETKTKIVLFVCMSDTKFKFALEAALSMMYNVCKHSVMGLSLHFKEQMVCCWRFYLYRWQI